MTKSFSRWLSAAALLVGFSPLANAQWVPIQTVDVPDQPFQEFYNVTPVRSQRLLVTKDASCQYVRISYNAFGRDQSGQVRLQLVLAPGAAAEDEEGRRGQTYQIQPG